MRLKRLRFYGLLMLMIALELPRVDCLGSRRRRRAERIAEPITTVSSHGDAGTERYRLSSRYDADPGRKKPHRRST